MAPTAQFVPLGDYTRVEFAYRSELLVVDAPEGFSTADPELIAALGSHPLLERVAPTERKRTKPAGADA